MSTNGTGYGVLLDTNILFKNGQRKYFSAFRRAGLVRPYISSISVQEYLNGYDKVWRNKYEQKYVDNGAPESVQNQRMEADKKRDLEYIYTNFSILETTEEEADNYSLEWSGSDTTDRFLATCAEKHGVKYIGTSDKSSIPRERLKEERGITTYSQGEFLARVTKAQPIRALKAVKSVNKRDDYSTGIHELKDLDIQLEQSYKEIREQRGVPVQAHTRNGVTVDSFVRKPRNH